MKSFTLTIVLLAAALFLLPAEVRALDAPTVTATAKGPNQINLTWAAVSNPGYGYLIEIQSAGDSRYSSYTEIAPWKQASGDSALRNTDPSCTYCYNPTSNHIPYWVTRGHYRDTQDDTAAQFIIFGLKPNTLYNVRVRSYSPYPSATYSTYSNVASARTLNYTVRYVNTLTGSDTNDGTNSTDHAWKTINKACQTLTAGQVGIVVGGFYANDHCTTTNSGSSGTANKIVLMSNPGDTVTITSFPASLYGIEVKHDYWVIDGINTSYAQSGGDALGLWRGNRGVWANSEHNLKNTSVAPSMMGSNNRVQGLWIHDGGKETVDEGSLFYLLGSDLAPTGNVLAFNHFTRGAHDTGMELNQANLSGLMGYNQWLNNIHDGGWGTGESFVDNGKNDKNEELPAVHHSLSEGNVIAYVNQLTPSMFKIGTQLSGDYITIRNNLLFGLKDDGYEINSLRGSAKNNLVYNNTIVSAGGRCFWTGKADAGPYTGNTFVNNICYKVSLDGLTLPNNAPFTSYATDLTWVVEYNNFYGGNPLSTSGAVIYGEGGTLQSITYADEHFPPFSFNDGLNVAPQFVNETAFADMHLTAASLMRGAGRAVTDWTWGTIGQTDLGAFDYEGKPPGPANLRYVQTGMSGSFTNGYLQWEDTTENETGFVIESRQCSPGCTSWTQYAQVGQNVTTYNLPPLTSPPTYTFRVKATIPSGPTGSSNEVEIDFSGGGCWTEIRNGRKVTVCTGNSCTTPTTLIVSEFRLRGAAGARDEFVELYNNSDTPINVCTTDSSGGWTLAARTASGASASPVFTVPYGTAIPARGHYLAVNSSPSGGYSLAAHPAGNGTTATGDITYTTDIEDNSGLALFKTANPANFTAANRLDAAGFSGAAGAIPDLYREGAGLSSVGTQNGEYTLYRKMTSYSGGRPQDTGDNAGDFQLVATDGGFYGSLQASLGAPGPENLSSPIQRNSTFGMTNLDTSQGSAVPPNRERSFTMVPNGTFGTLSIRRTVYNNTGGGVTRLRFRLVSLTTWPVPSGTADLRALTSGDVQVQVQGVWRTVKGTTLEQPPGQPNGGGYNSAMSVSLPQPLAPGATVDVQFLLGLQQTGGFSFLINIEALP